MSTTVDERVVQMKFDNKSFEQDVNSTLTTLEKLKIALRFDDAVKGLNAFRNATSTSMNTITSGIDFIRKRLSFAEQYMDHWAEQVLDTIKSKIISITKAFTLEPILTGLDEYKTKIDAIQVIKSNTMGKNTMDEITDSLDELNKYADKTIYNFAQMTSNVGKFVAQGLDTTQATKAIQGMANLAAASGASAQDMSRATYQMSQALGGTIRKIDWNSLRNANMATMALKDTIMDVARNYGIAIDDMIKKKGTFEDTLEEGWLSGKLFTEAMNMYSDVYSEAELRAKGYSEEQIKRFKDLAKSAAEAATQIKTLPQLYDVLKEEAQSGWTQSWEFIIGDYEQAIKLWTAVGNELQTIIGNFSNARNELLGTWEVNGGRQLILDALADSWNYLKDVLKWVKKAFEEVFPKVTYNDLVNLSIKIRDMAQGLELSGEAGAQIKRSFKGLFAVIDIGGRAILALIKGLLELTSSFTGAGEGILSATSSLGDFLVALDDSIKDAKTFEDWIVKPLKVISQYIKTFVTGFKEGFSATGNIFHGMISGIEKDVNKLMGLFKKKESTKNVESTGMDFVAILDYISDALDTLLSIIDKFGSGKVDEAIKTIGSIGNLEIPNKIIEGISKLIEILQKLWEASEPIRSKVIPILKEFGHNLIDFSLTDIIRAAAAITSIFVGLKRLSLGKAELAQTASSFLTQITNRFLSLEATINNIGNSFNSILNEVKNTLKTFQNEINAHIIMTIAEAVALLAGSVFILSLVPTENLFESGILIAGFIALLLGAIQQISKHVSIGDQLKMLISPILAIAFAASIMASAFKKVSSVDADKYLDSIISLGVLLAELGGTLWVLSKYLNANKAIEVAASMIALSYAIGLITPSFILLSFLKFDSVIHGLVALAGILISIGTFASLVSKYSSSFIEVAAGLVIMAAAIDILMPAVVTLSLINWRFVAAAIAEVLGLLIVIGGAAYLLGKAGEEAIFGAGIIMVLSVAFDIIAAGMLMLAVGISKLNGISFDSVINALLAIAGTVSVMTIFAGLASAVIPGAVAMLVLASALNLITKPLQILSKFETKEAENASKALEKIFAKLVDVASLANKCVLGSAAMVTIGLALALVTDPLVTLLGMDYANLENVTEALYSAFIPLVKIAYLASAALPGALSLIPMAAAFILFAGAVRIFAWSINSLAELGSEETRNLILGLATSIAYLGKISVGLSMLAGNMITASAGLFILSLSLGSLAGIVVTLKAADFSALTDSMKQFIIELGILSAVGLLMAPAAMAINKFTAALIGLASTIALICIVISVLSTESMKQFMESLDANLTLIIDKGSEIGNKFLTALGDSLNRVVDIGIDVMNGLVTGLDVGLENVTNKAKQIGANLIEGIRCKEGVDSHSDSKKTIAIGEDCDSGLVTGLQNGEIDVWNEAFNVGDITAKGIDTSMKNIDTSSLVENYVIQPIVDKVVESEPELTESGEDSAEFLNTGVINGIKNFDASDLINSIVGAISSEMQSKYQTLYNEGFALGNSAASGYQAGFKETASSKAALWDYRQNQNGTKNVGYSPGGSSRYDSSLKKDAIDDFKDLGEAIDESSKKSGSKGSKSTKELTEKVQKLSEALKENITNTDAYAYSAIAASAAANNMEVHLDGVSKSMNPVEASKLIDTMIKLSIAENATTDSIKGVGLSSSDSEKILEELAKTTGLAAEEMEKLKEQADKAKKNIMDTMDSIQKAIEGGISSFDKFKKYSSEKAEDRMSPGKLLENMKSQVDGVKEWLGNIHKLIQNENFSNDLAMKLAKMGPASFETVEAFSKMSAEQMKQATALYAEQLKLPVEGRDSIMSSFAEAGFWASDGFSEGILVNAANDKMIALSENALKALCTRLGINSPSTVMAEQGMWTAVGFGDGIESSSDYAVQKMIILGNRVYNALHNAGMSWSKWRQLGRDCAEGMRQGILSKAEEIAKAAAEVAIRALEAAKEAVDSHSPSKKFIELGKYCDQGFAIGLKSYAGLVSAQAAKVGESTLDFISQSISKASQIMEEGLDSSFSIRPVLDLSNVQYGASQMNAMLSQSKASTISVGYQSQFDVTEAQMNRMSKMMDDMSNKYVSAMKYMNDTRSELPVNVNVSLEGDAKGLFKAVRNQNDIFTHSTGRSAFA